MIYQITASVILAVFYGCYFIKIIAQHSKGINTDQIGKGKHGTQKAIELTLKCVSIAAPVIEVASIIHPRISVPAVLRITGLVTAAAGTTVFVCAVLHMRDSWRAGVPDGDTTELVTGGIYAVSRNPAFLGFDLVYAGIALTFFNPVLLAVSLIGMGIFHLQIVLMEEPFLLRVFGDTYAQYRKTVGRYLGRKQK